MFNYCVIPLLRQELQHYSDIYAATVKRRMIVRMEGKCHTIYMRKESETVISCRKSDVPDVQTHEDANSIA